MEESLYVRITSVVPEPTARMAQAELRLGQEVFTLPASFPCMESGSPVSASPVSASLLLAPFGGWGSLHGVLCI